ncbi:MAG TPA: TonB-dependent receptor [Flavisolibacter sp.]|nr:TonB-dependent receptor [Flavisolibacter sp.]
MKKLLALFCLISAVFVMQAQSLTQTVKGIVSDKISQKPLSGVSVQVEGTGLSAITSESGAFELKGVPAGRIRLVFSAIGYQPASIPELLVTTGKEVVLEVSMEQKVGTLDEVVVKVGKAKKGAVANEFAGSSARSFTVEEITRYAGGRNDPSKLVSNYAGVVSNNDSRNDIVVRGNSPAGVLWRIEGLPAPNPNHFSTLGTTGGPVSALNTNALKTSDFYTGAFPAEYGNALAAVFDINFRAGNAQTHERTVQLNLFSGLEAMLEGPLSGRKNGGSYLVGYRYSFARIGQSLGFDIGTQAVPSYQDWVYNIQFAASKAGRFSLFGMGGISSIDFIGSEIDTTDFYSRKDQDTYVRSRLFLFGAKHTVDLGAKAYLRTVISYGNTSTDFESYQYELPVPPYQKRWQITQVNDKQNMLRFSTLLNKKVSPSLSWRAGLTGEGTGLNTTALDREGKPETAAFEKLRDFDDNFLLLQYFGQGRYKPSEKLTVVAGLHGMVFTFNDRSMLEPRASVTYQLNAKNTVSLGYGLHGQLQPLPVYLYEKQSSSGIDQRNRRLDFSKAHHFVIGYESRFAPDWRIKLEGYHQSLFDIPVEEKASGFSLLNAGSDFTFPEKAGLVNRGTGTNTGVELTVERFLSKGFYLLASTSLFDSKYEGSDGVKRNSTFNYGYVANLLAGREWAVGSSSAFTFDIRFSTIGGRYATPVDVAQSMVQRKEVLDETRYNSERLDPYLRLDTKFGFRINSKKRKLSQTFYLDLQNVTNRENIFLRRYNPLYGTVGEVNQVGFFPDVLYRIQF